MHTVLEQHRAYLVACMHYTRELAAEASTMARATGHTRDEGLAIVMARELTDLDRWTFNEGSHTRLYEVLGAHLDVDGAVFRVWAPNAGRVSVIGDFNGWKPDAAPMTPGESGIWEARVDGVHAGHLYKFRITPRAGARAFEKADPHAFAAEADLFADVAE